jgi:hypothetical protein
VADVYILASPPPTLYVFPAQVHPATQVPFSGPAWQPIRLPRRREDDDETALAVLGAI